MVGSEKQAKVTGITRSKNVGRKISEPLFAPDVSSQKKHQPTNLPGTARAELGWAGFRLTNLRTQVHSIMPRQMRPINNKTTTMMRINPTAPPGAAPQFRLYPQFGSTPNNNKIRITNKTVPNIFKSLSVKSTVKQ